MATYNDLTEGKHAALVAATADTCNFTDRVVECEILNLGTASIFVTFDGTAPVVDADNTYLVPAGQGAVFEGLSTRQIQLISSGTPTYHVTRGQAGNRSISSVTVSAAVDTELPAAAALADNTANPTAPAVAAHGLVWDGAAWDRAPGDTANGLDVDVTRLPAGESAADPLFTVPGNVTYENGAQTTVGVAAVSVVAAVARKGVWIQNVGTQRMRVGIAAVTATTGILELAPDAAVFLATAQEVFAIRTGASDTTALASEVT